MQQINNVKKYLEVDQPHDWMFNVFSVYMDYKWCLMDTIYYD